MFSFEPGRCPCVEFSRLERSAAHVVERFSLIDTLYVSPRVIIYFLIISHQVWAPSGGWYANPPKWKRNTAFAVGALFVMSAITFKISSDNERRPIPPLKHIPSQRWCKHALEDDPSLAKK
jgi:hypothetical protein